MTLEQWAALPEDERGELVDGRLVEEEMPGYEHWLVVQWLAGRLSAWAEAHGGAVAGDVKHALCVSDEVDG